MSEKIIDYFGDSYKDLDIDYSIEKDPLGTGGAIKRGLEKCSQDFIYVLNGDSFLEIPEKTFNKNLKFLKEITIVARRVNNCSRYGRITEKNSEIISFEYNKNISGPGLISAGVYILPKNLLSSYKKNTVFSFETECLPEIINKNKVMVFESLGYFIDIGIPKDYLKAKIDLKRFI
tara:strand:- start:24 stop:551 length:528 start_codon:yes stop_codon:yes gene_type:complete